MIKAVAIAIAMLSAGSAVSAGDPFATPVTARVLPGWVQADGTRFAALHLTLLPGWKTYWRAPGDAGIPPTFDWSGSGNLGALDVTWPTPQVFYDNGMRSIGYKNELILPLTISPAQAGQPVHLKAEMDLGVCSDICMPHRLQFDAILDGMDSRPTPAIAAALAQRPYSQQEAGVRSATCRLEPTGDGFMIEARVTMPSAGGPEEMVIEPGRADIWVSEPETRREGADVIALSELIHVDGGSFALNRSDIRITVLGTGHAVDIRGCASD